jgi:putative ABC transport system permease protein
MRNPGRTAATSAALMVGLGLVVFVAMFAASLTSSFSRQLDELVKADVFAYATNLTTPIPGRTERAVRAVPGVESIIAMRFDQIEVDGRPANTFYDTMEGVDPAQLEETYTFEWVDGDDSLIAGLGPGEALVEEQFAKGHDISVGERYRIETPSGGEAEITAIGVYRDPTILQGTVVSNRTMGMVSTVRDPFILFVSVAEGADAAVVEADVKDALSRFPEVTVETRAEYKQTVEEQLNQIVYLVYALLAMSIVVSLFGIANSLFLAIHERTREFGLLKAVGTTSTQLRRIVRYESVIIAAIGAVLGIALGVAFATLTTASLSDFGLGFSVPIGQIAIFAVLALLVGVIAAVGPARRSSRVNVLEAIHQQ